MKKRNLLSVLAILSIFAFNVACNFSIGNFSNPTSKTQNVEFEQAQTLTISPEVDLAASVSTQTSQTPTLQTPQNILSSNLNKLRIRGSISLSGIYPDRLLWPSNTLQISSDLSTFPDLLIQNGPNLYPVLTESLTLSNAIPLPLNGNQILDFSPDATSLVVKDPSQTGVYTIHGKQLWLITEPANLYGGEYSSDGRYLAVTSSDEWRTVLYDVNTGNQIANLTGFETAAPIYTVIPAPGGKDIVWFARATLRLQNVSTGKLSNEIYFEDFINSIQFSSDGSKLILVVAGKLITLDVKTGQLINEVFLEEPALDLDVSADNRIIVLAYQQALQFFDLETLLPIAKTPVPGNTINASFSPDNRLIVTITDEEVFYILNIP